ncbi:hypothetical protein ACFLTP_03320 [Chloroflexota bacterium]
MSCYFRNLRDILNKAGIQVTASNKKQIDKAIHDTVEVTYKDCPTTWKKLKQEAIGDELKRCDFVESMQKAIG